MRLAAAQTTRKKTPIRLTAYRTNGRRKTRGSNRFMPSAPPAGADDLGSNVGMVGGCMLVWCAGNHVWRRWDQSYGRSPMRSMRHPPAAKVWQDTGSGPHWPDGKGHP